MDNRNDDNFFMFLICLVISGYVVFGELIKLLTV